MSDPFDVRSLFLSGAGVIVEAIADPAVRQAWNDPSVLEDQLVSGLAGHLARGGVWAVADYLHAGTPDGPVDFTSAGEYFATFAAAAQPADHQAIRDRGAAVAAAGRDALLVELRERLASLEPELGTLPGDHPIAVVGGSVMHLDRYLETRIVEQAVHLDDLARSVGRDPWRLPQDHVTLAIAVGTDIALRRHGPAATLRALYRRGCAEPALPVL